VFAIVLVGCAATTVRPNPGRFDRGVRYYRPKPYLLLQPARDKDNNVLANYVTITKEYLPDFSEEYSIHVRAGLGSNKTKIVLTEGWNLTELNVEVDQQFDESLKAVADLVKAIPTGAARAAPSHFTVRGSNVPIGYYEAVISRDEKYGVKRLYGWRYVGFAPFNACPFESGGVDCANCHSADIFALVVEGDTMVFRRIKDFPEASGGTSVTNVTKSVPAAMAPPP
jgi:hypothetical protein